MLFVSPCDSVCSCVVVDMGHGRWNPYGVCSLLGKFRLPVLPIGVLPPGVFCPEPGPPEALAEAELELVEELGFSGLSAPAPWNVGIPGVGEKVGHGGAEA